MYIMDNLTLYLALDQSLVVPARKVCVGDIAKIFCTDKDISHKVSKLEVFTFPNSEEGQIVITALALIKLINTNYKELHIETIGDAETIVYYKNTPPVKSLKYKLRAAVLMVFAFLGTGYSIMSYNGDVGSADLIKRLYRLFMGSDPAAGDKQLSLAIVIYSIGLCIGMIIFFNHGINNKDTDDPTPLQVQMRLYEQNVNQAIIIDSDRHKGTIDVD